jgi:hypothetical protein
MQSKTEDFFAEIEAFDFPEKKPRSFGLYEEYSQTAVGETIAARREAFEKADSENRRKLKADMEREVDEFRLWLEETKNLDSDAAHYCAVSLKSLLLGLPMGVHVACLFDVALEAHERL